MGSKDNEQRPNRELLASLGVIIILIGWTMFNASAELREFSAPGVLVLTLGWATMTWALSDAGNRKGVLYACGACLVTSVALCTPHIVRRNYIVSGIAWALHLSSWVYLGNELTRGDERNTAIRKYVSIALIVFGTIAQFGERKLDFQWVLSGEPRTSHGVFSFGSVLLTLGYSSLPSTL